MIIDTKMKRKIEDFLEERGISDIPIRNFGRLLIITFLMDYMGECVELVETREGEIMRELDYKDMNDEQRGITNLRQLLIQICKVPLDVYLNESSIYRRVNTLAAAISILRNTEWPDKEEEKEY